MHTLKLWRIQFNKVNWTESHFGEDWVLVNIWVITEKPDSLQIVFYNFNFFFIATFSYKNTKQLTYKPRIDEQEKTKTRKKVKKKTD